MAFFCNAFYGDSLLRALLLTVTGFVGVIGETGKSDEKDGGKWTSFSSYGQERVGAFADGL